MNFKSILLTTSVLAVLTATSCKKEDNNSTSSNTSSSSLTTGTSYLSFTTDIAYNGKTSHEYKHSVPSYVSQCKRQTVGSGEVLILDGGGATNMTNVTNNMVRLNVTTGATTSGGNITLNMDDQNTDFIMTFSESRVSGTTATVEAMSMESGKVLITKLSATEIEGTFSGTAVNEDDNKTYKVTNGKFSGKF